MLIWLPFILATMLIVAFTMLTVHLFQEVWTTKSKRRELAKNITTDLIYQKLTTEDE